MALKKLPVEIQSLLNAAAKIRSFNKAVEELVYNSLDAEATSIAIRIDIPETIIQVIDNGSGIAKSDLPLLGQRYTTSKITNSSTFKNVPKTYGFHGESLSNIIETSQSVKITSRYKDQEETWVKYFCNGQHKDSHTTHIRPSKGTTVEIKEFLYNLHIPKEATNELNELEKIKSFLQKVALVKTNISLSLRDNNHNEIIFKIHKNSDIYQTLASLFKIEEKDLQEIQIEKNLYKAKGYIGKQIGEPTPYRWMYLNGRFIYKSVLHDIINSYFVTDKQLCHDKKVKHYTHKHNIKKHIKLNLVPTYFIFITCPYFDYDINYTSLKTNIEFSNWTQIELLLEKLVMFYKGDMEVKEIEVEHPRKKRKIENTREEVKRIMEKVLGTKSKNQMQMRKEVKGKIIKKRLKNKVTDNMKNKIKNKLSSQKRATEDNPCDYQSSLPKTNSIPLFNKPQIQNVNIPETDLPEQNNGTNVKNKTVKKCREKFKINPEYPVNSGTEYNVNKAESTITKKRYNHHKYSNNLKSSGIIKDPLNDNVIRKYSNRRSNNIQLQKSKHDVIRNKREQLAVNVNNLTHLQKVTNECLKSSDLVKTVLNSQRSYNSYVGIDSVYYKSKLRPTEYVKHVTISDKTLTNARNIVSNVSTSCNSKLTYESHRYCEDVISKYYLSIKKMDKFIAEKCKSNPTLQNYIKESLNDVTSKRGITNQTLYQNVQYSKDLSHLSDFTNNYTAVNYFETFKRQSEFNEYQHAALNQYRITASIQNTYTIINSDIPLEITTYSDNINNKTIDEFHGAGFFNQEDDISSNILKETEHFDVRSPEINKTVENNIEVIFISNSKTSITHPLSEGFEPLNFCEAVYQNTSTNNNMDTNIDLHDNQKDEMNYEKNRKNCEIQEINDRDLSQPIDKTEIVSNHFPKISNNCNVNMNELIKNHSQRHNQSIEPEISKNINHENKTISNKFQLQNRHNFVPKGMSPIFENCQTKNICSYNLEMDYFEDDLYHNFANDVLDNFKIFEKGITNVNNVRTENLKRDHVSLKFSAQSLRNAKVFKQIDKKFILAELCSDSLNTKHIVLFDQHAVHERIRLENNLSEYKNGEQWFSMDCEKLSLKLPKDVILYMNNFKEKIEQFGLRWKIANECLVTFSAIPQALFGKHSREPDVILKSIKSLILEEMKAIKSLGGNILLYPKSIMDLVFSEACRYAIKFGDKLSNRECAMLISSLSNCKTPFQCAHGRPVMAVLMDLKNSSCNYEVDKAKLKMFINKK